MFLNLIISKSANRIDQVHKIGKQNIKQPVRNTYPSTAP